MPFHTHPHPISLSLSPSLSFFLPSNQPSGSVCKEERWPAVLCTRFDLSRFNPLWLPRHTPQPLHGLTFIHLSPLLSSLHPHTCPLHWQSHIIIFFVGDVGPYCLRVPLSLITIEQKQVLTGGTRRAALMSVPIPPRSSFFPGKWQNVYTYTPPDHTAPYSLWQWWHVKHGIFVQSRLLGSRAVFLGGDVSVTIVGLVFCSESRSQSCHLHAFDPCGQLRLCSFGDKNCVQQGLCVCVSGGWASVCLYWMFWRGSSLHTPCAKLDCGEMMCF